MKVLVIASYDRSLITFRGDLLRSMVESGHEVVACSPNFSDRIRESLALLGVRHHKIRMARTGMNPLMDLVTFAALLRLIRAERPDRVLAYTVKAVIYASLAAKLLRFPQLYSMITGLGYAFSSRPGFKRKASSAAVRVLYRLARGGSKCLFFQNPDDLAEFRRCRLIGKHTGTVMINGSGVNIDFYPVVPLNQDPVFLLIGRLVVEKGVREYAEAAKVVREQYPQARFMLAGWLDSNPDAISESELQGWIGDGTIEYLGQLEDVRPALASCRIFVLPSYYREGTPRTILEAMSMGRPVITADTPGCRETTQNGVNGYLVRQRDSTDLAEAMVKLLESPQTAEKMGRASRRIAQNKYDVKKVNRVILNSMGLS